VPPPPVAGAPVGTGLVDRLGACDGDADECGEGLAEEWERAEALLAAAGGLAPAVPPGCAVADARAPGEDVGNGTEGEDVVHAQTAAEARMVTMPQPAVSRALSAFLACNGLFTTGIPGYSSGAP
jgi:hypothetical protein